MEKKILVLGAMPDTAVELLRKLMQMGGGQIEVIVAEDRIMGASAKWAVFDEIVHDPWNIGEVIREHKLQCKPEPMPVRMRVNHHNKVPQTKGDRHKNRRYRWS